MTLTMIQKSEPTSYQARPDVSVIMMIDLRPITDIPGSPGGGAGVHVLVDKLSDRIEKPYVNHAVLQRMSEHICQPRAFQRVGGKQCQVHC